MNKHRSKKTGTFDCSPGMLPPLVEPLQAELGLAVTACLVTLRGKMWTVLNFFGRFLAAKLMMGLFLAA